MRIIDMHCDTLLEGYRNPEESFYDGARSVTLKMLEENHSMVQFFAIYLSGREKVGLEPWQLFKEIHAYYQKQMEEYSHIIRPVYVASDVEKNREEGFLSSLLTVEDGVFIDEGLKNLEKAYRMGVRLITLLWNYENPLGFPCSDHPKDHLRALKPFGIEVVEKMNEMGMIIDTSHMSEGGFYDVARYSKKPFIASHSCARALCDHRRNLTDHQLKTLGASGGVVGVNFEASFLKKEGQEATFDDVIKHISYIKDKAGIEAVAFGSDFDGIDATGDLLNYGSFKGLLQRMEDNFTESEIDKICRLNALRIMREVL